MAGIAAWSLLISAAALFGVGCGGDDAASSPIGKAPLEVAAFPPGFMFEQSATVELSASRPARIFYTVNGDNPIGPTALVYSAPIQVAESTRIMFIAKSTDDFWSSPASEFYESAPPSTMGAELIQRGLGLDANNHFFSPKPGDTNLTATFHLRSIGIQAVHITNIHIDVNASGRAFFEDGVFKLEGPAFQPTDLAPGNTLELTVRYMPTDTLRSAGLYIDSDEETHSPTSPLFVELWGRVFGN